MSSEVAREHPPTTGASVTPWGCRCGEQYRTGQQYAEHVAERALAAADAVQPRTAPLDRERLVQITMKHLTDAHAYLNLRHNAETLTDAILAEWGEPAEPEWEYGHRCSCAPRTTIREPPKEGCTDVTLFRRTPARGIPAGPWEVAPDE